MTTKTHRAATSPRPEGMTEEHFEYLDELRESGVTNMYGAAEYLVDAFDLKRAAANKYLSHWMETFAQRHKEE